MTATASDFAFLFGYEMIPVLGFPGHAYGPLAETKFRLSVILRNGRVALSSSPGKSGRDEARSEHRGIGGTVDTGAGRTPAGVCQNQRFRSGLRGVAEVLPG